MRPMRAPRKWKGHWALAVLLGCLALLALAQSASAAATMAVGKVTDAKGAGIENVEVRYYKGSENEWSRYVTNKNGEYGKDINIEYGEYKVEFIPPSGSKYALQYYEKKLTYATANTVYVEDEKETTVNAVLPEGGSISGTVTSAATHQEIGHVEVTAYERNPPNNAVAHVETNQFGDYELAGIPTGSYTIEFRPSFESDLDYAPQFYPEKAKFSEADEIKVSEASKKSNVDAQLVKGGSISGTVTDAATSQPLSGVLVVATEPAGMGALIARASTNASGEYTMVGLGDGSFDIVFEILVEGKIKPGEVRYLPQLYKEDDFPEHLSSPGELFVGATPVGVTIPNTTSGIDAALVRYEPVDKVAPVASGTPAVGKTLSCSNGSWTGLGMLTYTYQWLRDGTAIGGANASAYTVQGADEGKGLACKVTASNEVEKEVARSASATSNTLTVPGLVASPPPPPKPRVTLSSSKILVSGSSARVPMTCAEANCSGSIELTEQTVVKSHKGKRTTFKKQTLVLGSGKYSLVVGHSATIDVALTAKGKSALVKAKRHKLSVKIAVSVGGGTTLSESIELSQAPPAKKRKGKRK